MNQLLRVVGLVLFTGLLAACNDLPRGAPSDREVLSEAQKEDSDVAIYPVTRAFLPSLARWPAVGEPDLKWIGTSRGPSSSIIHSGDKLNLRIWDSGDNSLITSPEQRSVEILEVEVSSSGSIFVPYVGDVVVTGRTQDAARREIQFRMEAIVPSAQVQLSVNSGRKNSIDLVGGVGAPGSYPLPDRNFTVLNLLAMAGGVSSSLENPQIRLVRGGQIYGTSVKTLFENPGMDTRLTGGDKVIVEEDRRYFISLGATGREALHPFTMDDLSALAAVSIAGGVSDYRGDPQGILVLREYPLSAIQPGRNGPREQRVIFTIDLTDSDGLFSARNFKIRSGDVVMATESPVTSVQTILSLFGLALGGLNSVQRLQD